MINDQDMEKTIIEKLKVFITKQAVEARSQWNRDLCESDDIEKFGFNEFVGGKADAYEDCLEMLEKYENKA